MTRALVVDDDEDFARLVERRLLVLGWEVETVNTPIGLSARLLVEPTINVLIKSLPSWPVTSGCDECPWC